MRIVHTEASCGWGGQEIRILEEAKGLIERGHDVSVLCPTEARIYQEAARWGVPIEALPIGRKNFRGLFALRRWLKRHDVDVLNTHSSTDSWLAALACATLGSPPPIVRTRHISAAIADYWPTRWLYTKATRHIVTTGEALRRELIERNRYPAAMIVSVPTGVDTKRFSPGDRYAARKELGLDQNHRYLGILATLRSWKGHLYLLEAFAQLNRPDWKLLIVGDGPMRDRIDNRIAELGIAKQVILAGQQRNPEIWLRAMDLFCLPSYANEGVPQALIQAMMTGLPVISTPVGSIAELVDDGVTGISIEPRSSAAIRSAIESLIAHPEKAQAMGRAAMKLARERYALSNMLDRMEHCFAVARAVA